MLINLMDIGDILLLMILFLRRLIPKKLKM